MQTFLPFKDFHLSARCLDVKRLGCQRNEAFEILKNVLGIAKGWQHHATVRMWKDHPFLLKTYGLAICFEWQRRGYKDTVYDKFLNLDISVKDMQNPPEWLGLEELHSSHRAALLFKNLKYYSQFNWIEKPELNYYWPK